MLLTFVVGCKGKADDKPAESDDGADEGEDPGIDEPVPMALVDAAQLAQVRVQYAAFSSGGNASDEDTLTQVINLSSRSLGQMSELTIGVETLMAQVVGPDGMFPAADLAGFEAGVPRVFSKSQSDGTKRLARLAVAANSVAERRYVVELFEPAATSGRWTRRLRYAFDKSASDPQRANYEMAAVITDVEGVARNLVLAYDHDAGSAVAHLGRQAAVATEPAVTFVDLRFVPDSTAIDLSGGLIWAERSAPAGLFPRYHSPLTGDVELFQSAFEALDPFRTVQREAFVPEAEATASDPWSDQEYPRLMNAYTLKAMRDASVNESCETYGTVINERSGAALPADVCTTNGDVQDADVLEAVAKACKAGTLPLTSSNIGAAGTAKTYDLCVTYEEVAFLTNPQYLTGAGGTRRLLKDGEVPDVTHAKLMDRLESLQPFGAEALRAFEWEAAPEVGEADFGPIESLD